MRGVRAARCPPQLDDGMARQWYRAMATGHAGGIHLGQEVDGSGILRAEGADG